MKIFHFNIGRLLLSLVLTCSILACSKFTDVDLPSSQLGKSTVFKEKATANAAVVDIYSKIRENGLLSGRNTGLSIQLGVYTDELQYYGGSGTDLANSYNNTLLSTSTGILNLWNYSYSQIYAANAVIEGVNQSTGLADIDKEQLLGEALFVRGLIHFYLVNTFGPIPYIKTTNYQENSMVTRKAETEVYALIKSDFEQSSALLHAQYIGTERVRPNKWAAQAMLARVCLYMQKWDEAATAASTVLNQTDLYKWPTDINGVFLKGSTSTIWQLMPLTVTANTHEGNAFVFTQGPPSSIAISASLYNAFSGNDFRREQWLKKVVNGTSTWYHAYKYKEQTATTPSKEYSIILRIAEQYLIRSEARARLGNLSGAKDDLNKVRNLAGLGNTSANTADEIVDAVLQERRLELFTELGHRFFDLKRLAKLNLTLSPLKPQWDTNDRLFPIPQSELLLNPNLTPQNAGY